MDVQECRLRLYGHVLQPIPGTYVGDKCPAMLPNGVGPRNARLTWNGLTARDVDDQVRWRNRTLDLDTQFLGCNRNMARVNE